MPGELEVEKPADGGPGAGEGEEENGAESEAAAEEKKEPPAAKPMVGIIYPPPEVRSILLLLPRERCRGPSVGTGRTILISAHDASLKGILAACSHVIG